MARILCVDSDPDLTALMGFALERAGYHVVSAHTGHDALDMTQARRPDLVTMELDLSDMDGIVLLCRLRSVSTVPVIVVSDRARRQDVWAALHAGADDYVIKPFDMPILVERIAAVLRRATTPAGGVLLRDEVYRVQGAVFNRETNMITGQGHTIKLTRLESRILYFLLRHDGAPLSVERIREHLGSTGNGGSTIKAHIYHLRRKLAALPGEPNAIHTVPGVGYRAQQTDADGHVVLGRAPEPRTDRADRIPQSRHWRLRRCRPLGRAVRPPPAPPSS